MGNVDKHSLLLAPAERADVIVDFSQHAGQTLILYNDAPAAFPARVASYDYYTGGPDLYPVGAPKILPGYGPNTRTIMQIKVSGSKDGKPTTYTWDLFDKYDPDTGIHSMARTTGYTCAAVTRLVLDGGYSQSGISAPEIVGRADN